MQTNINMRFLIAFLFVIALPVALHAQQSGASAAYMSISREHALKFGSLPMQSVSGRIQPVNTFSSEVLRKLHKSDKILDLDSDQFLLSLLCLPEMWMQIPLIICDNKDITFNHDLTDGYCSYIEMFDSNGRYKLETELNEAFAKPVSTRSGYEKDLIKLDEQVNILHQLFDHRLIYLFPVKNDETHTWYAPGDELPETLAVNTDTIRGIMSDYCSAVINSIQTGNWETADEALKHISEWQATNNTLPDINRTRIKAEVIYNKTNLLKFCRKIYLIIGASLLVIAFMMLFSNHKKLGWLGKVLIIHLVVVMVFHFVVILLRWYIAGYAPWSNSYETMVLLSFLCIFAGMLFARRSIITLALSSLLAGVILFVSSLNWMNPQITPLVPVLKSPWLMIHVALIMVAYGFFGISCLLGLTNIIMMKLKSVPATVGVRIRELTIINEMSLLAGLAFLTAGVFVGAIWANESWGRYWGWDPKETWALITIIVYAVVTHLRMVKKWFTPFRFNLISVIAFMCVLMTYFGVNYLLSGMHSYN